MIKHFKAEPSEYVRKTVNGIVKKEGVGISFFYLPFYTSIELVSTALVNQPFAFTEISSDNQEVTLQGELLYQITKPELTLIKYNFSIDPKTKQYITDDAKKLPGHLLQIIRADARKIVQATSLEKLITMCDDLSKSVGDDDKKNELIQYLGVRCDTYFSAIKPKPEIAKALEADYREALLQKADEAIYRRRAIAVEKERAIRTNEVTTEIEIEEQRKQLVILKAENAVKEAEAMALTAKAELSAFDGKDAPTLAALALYQLGANAEKIQNLTITPEIISTILAEFKK